MFRESLLDSSPQSRKRKRWPMAAAFTLEIIAAGVLVMLPLLTTGVIPVSAHVIACPIGSVRIATHTTHERPSAAAANQPTYSVVALADNRHHAVANISGPSISEAAVGPDLRDIGVPDALSNFPLVGNRPTPVATPKPKPLIVSNMSEGHLLVKVEPVYPHIALITHRNGVVQLHALIAKDGTIQSLSVANGEAMFVTAAIDAVKQWRYRPYLLNGEPVEVETFITVTFKGIRD